MSAVTELAATIGAHAACGVLAVPRASYYRHRKPRTAPPRQARVRTPSPRALSEAERRRWCWTRSMGSASKIALRATSWPRC